MYTLICENSRGQQINLTKCQNYVVTKIDGLTPPKASINTTKVALGDGSIYNSSVVNGRNIVIELYIAGDIERNRQLLYKIFKVKQYCKIYFKNQYRNVFVDGYVESFEATIFNMTQKVQISILCPSAYFTNITPQEYYFSWATNGFQFPFSIPEAGIEFGSLQNISTIDVVNNGDVDAGVTIDLSATGAVIAPKIINTDTGEFMLINYAMASGDTIRITTHRGNKKILMTSGGVTTNIINRLSSDSTWFSILTGDNIFAYQATSGGNFLDIKFTLSELYEGV